MIKESSVVFKRECSDSVFDWFFIFWSVIFECLVEIRFELVYCFLVVVFEFYYLCFLDFEKINKNK